MDGPLRTAVWNVLYALLLKEHLGYEIRHDPALAAWVPGVWVDHANQPYDRMPMDGYAASDFLKDRVLSAPWNEVYDLLEWLAQHAPVPQKLTGYLNRALERYRSGYRIVAGEVTALTSESEIESVEEAVASLLSGVRHHIKSALRLFADREAPDYANSVKESMSAVEAAVRMALNDERITAGDGLKKLKAAIGLHPALAAGFSSLYGYTSDEGGIRHAAGGRPDVSEAEARYFLVSCSAFVNYLAVKTS